MEVSKRFVVSDKQIIAAKESAMSVSKYTEDERLRIGKEIYDREHTKYTAAVKYDISPYTADEAPQDHH